MTGAEPRSLFSASRRREQVRCVMGKARSITKKGVSLSFSAVVANDSEKLLQG